MGKMICLDMDGTIADLYSFPHWLDCLASENIAPYYWAKPLVDMTRLRNILTTFAAAGWEIRVISWLAKDSSETYKKAVRQVKIQWLENHELPLDKIHLVAYGTTKADCVRRAGKGPKILIDDNAKIREGWHLGDTIDASNKNWLDELEALL